jgi:hypothetical protein
MTHDHVGVRASPVLPVTDLDRALAHYADDNLLRFGGPLASGG